ncbi:hypothetical protein [Streptomyces sp. WAC 06725]|uniref:hypothetical protein n=1 Tax=Streptomyces sp. WAC 06725 TaxID=2203209 RepID=UPI00163BCE01|nr:hypothetical protein [Streptomyces sp. WAC 06725]
MRRNQLAPSREKAAKSSVMAPPMNQMFCTVVATGPFDGRCAAPWRVTMSMTSSVNSDR